MLVMCSFRIGTEKITELSMLLLQTFPVAASYELLMKSFELSSLQCNFSMIG